MISRLLRVLACAAFLSKLTPAFAATDCDRACLKTALDQYLNAVIKHDPSAAPLFVAFRQTETRLSSGWAPACGRP
jgi:hypothetical protein